MSLEAYAENLNTCKQPHKQLKDNNWSIRLSADYSRPSFIEITLFKKNEKKKGAVKRKKFPQTKCFQVGFKRRFWKRPRFDVMAILRFQVKLVRSADALPQKFMTRSIIYVNYTAVFVPQTFVLAKEYVRKQLKWNEMKTV